MSGVHPLQCRCGTLKGEVATGPSVNRAICYCKDCQAFAYALNCADRVLDKRGGTDIVQTSPRRVRLTAGTEQLRCLRLTDVTSTTRWYAGCCNTPIGNTVANYKISFVGLIHTALEAPNTSLDASFGPVTGYVYTKNAVGEPKLRQSGLLLGIARLGSMMLASRITGTYRDTPFFDRDGKPHATPRVLSADEHRGVMEKVARHGSA